MEKITVVAFDEGQMGICIETSDDPERRSPRGCPGMGGWKRGGGRCGGWWTRLKGETAIRFQTMVYGALDEYLDISVSLDGDRIHAVNGRLFDSNAQAALDCASREKREAEDAHRGGLVCHAGRWVNPVEEARKLRASGDFDGARRMALMST
jgi:hypothetical protein